MRPGSFGVRGNGGGEDDLARALPLGSAFFQGLTCIHSAAHLLNPHGVIVYGCVIDVWHVSH